MSVLGELRKLLSETGYELAQDIYDPAGERKDRYIVYNLAGESGTNYADNVPQEELVQLQVHIFLPGTENPKHIKKAVKELLLRGGFSYPEVALDTLEESVETTNSDGRKKPSKKRHICLYTNITEKLEV